MISSACDDSLFLFFRLSFVAAVRTEYFGGEYVIITNSLYAKVDCVL